MTSPTIVSGSVATFGDLDKDEAWLQDWLKEQPDRLGLGDLNVADGEPVQDDDGNPAFLAADEDRYFSVDVNLGEMDASHGFQLLDNWARNRVRHPDKTHVAVLVTEDIGDRYRSTLETLSEHLPLVVVELQFWLGDSEAILVPHVALASDDVDLTGTPAAKAAEAVAAVAAPVESDDTAEEAEEADVPDAEATPAEDSAPQEDEPTSETLDADDAETAEAVAAVEASSESKDDTGVADPWGLPQAEADEDAGSENGSRLLNKIGN